LITKGLDKLRIKFGVLATEKAMWGCDRAFLQGSYPWQDSYGEWAIGILHPVIGWAYGMMAGIYLGLSGTIEREILHFCKTKVY
jgi:hypothetical protein